MGTEIDVIKEEGTKLTAIEIKSGKTFSKDFLTGLTSWINFSGETEENCLLVYAGEINMNHNGVNIIFWDKI